MLQTVWKITAGQLLPPPPRVHEPAVANRFGQRFLEVSRPPADNLGARIDVGIRIVRDRVETLGLQIAGVP